MLIPCRRKSSALFILLLICLDYVECIEMLKIPFGFEIKDGIKNVKQMWLIAR